MATFLPYDEDQIHLLVVVAIGVAARRTLGATIKGARIIPTAREVGYGASPKPSTPPKINRALLPFGATESFRGHCNEEGA